MATLKELRNIRIQKLNKLRELGIDPYPADSTKTASNKSIVEDYSSYEGKTVFVTGRIFSIREHGGLVFVDLKDHSAVIQLYIKEENFTPTDTANSEIAFENMHLLDIGDFVEAYGVVTKTQTGQVSVELSKLRLLTKSLRPLPDKHSGLQDRETRMRRRYLDTTINDDVRMRYVRRAKFWQATREFLNARGFLEINIPVLEHTPGGADANPFITHMDSIDQDFYLRISHELYLKRLIGGGYEKVYEIGPRFRNEGLSDEHLPEHMAMEFYWAYADWETGMDFIEEMFRYIIDTVYEGQMQFKMRGFDVDFSKKWERIDFQKLMMDKYGIDIYNTTVDQVEEQINKHKIKGDFNRNLARGIDNLWKNLRKEIAGPAFLINHPKYLSPLAKSDPENPTMTQRIQPIIAGSELGNGWSELNDPLDQLERFTQQQALRDAGDDEAQFLDIDYVEMLEYGMPPTFGWGHSERVFWFFEDVPAREGVPFPQLKHHIDATTKDIYNLPDDFGVIACTKVTESTNPITNELDLSNSGNGSKELTIDSARSLLAEHMQNLNLRRHCYAVGHTLRALRDYYVSKGIEVGDLSADDWEIIGTLHDSDWEKTTDTPDQHTIMLLSWLNAYKVSPEIINVFKSHNNKITNLRDPETLLEWSLECCDELTGFIAAVTLVRPSKKVADVDVASVLKKWKQKEFARAVDRDHIAQCETQLNIPIEEFVQITLAAMQANADDLGL